MSTLYTEIIQDAYKHPAHRGELPEHTHAFEDENPLCGDTLRIEVVVEDGAIADARFQGRGCAISQASAELMLDRMIGQSSDWSRIDQFLIAYVVEPSMAATVFASSFASALELVREGLAEIHQKESFAPIYMRKRVGANGSATHDAQENA